MHNIYVRLRYYFGWNFKGCISQNMNKENVKNEIV
jgi:hypothetical protein